VDALVEDSREHLDEEVTVTDPFHPLAGRRFRVASRPLSMPGRLGEFVMVFYRPGVLLRIPAAALGETNTGQRTKLTGEAISELMSIAQSSDAWPPSTPSSSGKASPKRCGRKSPRT